MDLAISNMCGKVSFKQLYIHNVFAPLASLNNLTAVIEYLTWNLRILQQYFEVEMTEVMTHSWLRLGQTLL